MVGVFLETNIILWGVYGPALRIVYVGVGGSLKHPKKWTAPCEI